MRTTLLVTMALMLACVSCASEPEEKLERLDAVQTFRLVLGRGSGLDGLHTVALTHDGNVTLYRRCEEVQNNVHYDYWEKTTLQLPKDAIAELIAEIEKQGVLRLNRAYNDPDIDDGTQWVFWAQQGDKETSVYCNNKFPKPLKRFAETLDATLAKNGMGKVRWERVPEDDRRDVEKRLWDSVK